VGFERTGGLRVLEIGCGCGSEAERFARAGAHYTAVDLTSAAVNITRRRFQLANLEGRFVKGDAENLPFADGSFDLVYSHGVLHHTPDTPRTIREVHRVLSAGGQAVIMLYYRDSFNYYVNLGIVRRLRAHLLRTEFGIKLARTIFGETEQDLRRHAELIRENPSSYIEMQNMLNRNTDGPDNPLSQVFSKASARQMFPAIQERQNRSYVLESELAPGYRKAASSPDRGTTRIMLGLAPLDLRAEATSGIHSAEGNSVPRSSQRQQLGSSSRGARQLKMDGDLRSTFESFVEQPRLVDVTAL